MDSEGVARGRVKQRPTDPDEIKCWLVFMSAMHQPVVSGRTVILRDDRYREHFQICSDYDLWVRLAHDHPLANLPEVLALYRQGSHPTSKQKAKIPSDNTMAVQRELLERLEIEFTDEDLLRHFQIPRKQRFGIESRADHAYLRWLEEWMTRLHDARQCQGSYDGEVFERVLRECWDGVWGRALRSGHLWAALRYASERVPSR